MAGQVSPGKLIAFLFLVQLFTGPVQIATEVLNEMQNAVAGWRRVLAVLETSVDVVSPEQSLAPIGSGPASLEVMTMFRKPDAMTTEVDLRYVGFDIPNEFVVGYGLDYAGRYRNLTDVATLAPHVYA